MVIIPQAGINPIYFNAILESGMDKFMNKYATGINIQESEIGKFEVALHNLETQKAVADMYEFIGHEQQQVKDEITGLKKFKNKLMNNMFV